MTNRSIKSINWKSNIKNPLTVDCRETKTRRSWSPIHEKWTLNLSYHTDLCISISSLFSWQSESVLWKNLQSESLLWEVIRPKYLYLHGHYLYRRNKNNNCNLWFYRSIWNILLVCNREWLWSTMPLKSFTTIVISARGI